MNKFIILLFFLINNVFCQFSFNKNNFKVISKIFHWNQMGYEIDKIKYTSDANKQINEHAIFFDEEIEEKKMFFKQYNNIPIGVEVDQTEGRERVFITVPRRRFGIPSTLNYVNLRSSSASPLLLPYPNSDAIPSLDSVYRPRIDACKRLWVVDTGLIEAPNGLWLKKRPEIIIFDLKTDREIFRQPFSPDVSDIILGGSTSGFTSITVDVTESTCDDAHAYITDLLNNRLIVFSLREKSFWQFQHRSFSYDVGATNFTIGDYLINWKDGLFSAALTDADESGKRKVYYHPFVSTQEFSISNEVLKNRSADFEMNFKLEGVRGAWSQSATHVYHAPTKTLFFANVAQGGVLCWNTRKPLTSKTPVLVAQDKKELMYISDMKIEGDNLWMLTNNMPKFIYSSLNTQEDNFSLYLVKVHDLIAGTKCELK